MGFAQYHEPAGRLASSALWVGSVGGEGLG
jgi:hypothetical protein